MLRGPASARRSPAADPDSMGAVGSRYREGAAQAEPGLPEARRVGRDQQPPSRTRKMPRQSVRRGTGLALLPCQRAFRGLLEPDARKRASPVLRGAGRSNAPGLPGESPRLPASMTQPMGIGEQVSRDRPLPADLGSVGGVGAGPFTTTRGFVQAGRRRRPRTVPGAMILS